MIDDLELLHRPAWHANALGQEYPHLPSIPPRGVDPRLVVAMRAVCSRCLLRAECVAFAGSHPDTAGVWGSTTFADRHALRRHAAA